jgi:4-amino-4-deoxy-L-arabinose transferase-like glycosyltransferase
MSKRTLQWLSVILVIAALLRFSRLPLTPPGLYPDEAVDGNNALHALRTGDFKVFYTANNGEEGLFANVEAVVLAASGVQEPWTLRLPSAIFGFLTVLGLFFLARELFKSDRVALLAAFFLATSFWHVNFSRIGFRAIMAPFFAVWSLYFFTKSVRTPRFVWSAWYAALAGASFGLGFYSYISYRITPLLFLVMFPFFWRERRFWRAAALSGAVAFLIALPIGLYFLHHPADFFGRTSQVSVLGSANPVAQVLGNALRTASMLEVHGDDNWRHNISGRPEIYWPVGIAFMAGVILSLVIVVRRNRPDGDQEEQSRAEQSRAEQSRAEQSRAERNVRHCFALRGSRWQRCRRSSPTKGFPTPCGPS